jgi:hypothetical protein
VRGVLNALWRDLEERREVAETLTVLLGMISKVVLEPGSTQVEIYDVTMRSRLYPRFVLTQPG